MNKIRLTFENGEVLDVDKGASVREVINLLNKDDLVALKVNGNAVDADYEIDEDVYINFITVNDRTGRKIYTKGLEYVYIMAVRDLYGEDAVVEIKHSLDKFIYTEIKMKKRVDEDVINKIKSRMKEIIASDLPFKNVSVSRKDAYDYHESLSEYENV